MSSFYVENFGCRATQADGAAIEQQFRNLGLNRADDPARADYLVLNTCAVTAAAEQDARAAIRRLRRRNPHCKIVVTGCYAQRAPNEIARLPGVSQVIGNSHKHTLAQITLGGELETRIPPNREFIPASKLQIHPVRPANIPADVPRKLLGGAAPAEFERERSEIFVSDIFAHTELLAAPVFDSDSDSDSSYERTRPNLKIQDGCNNRCSFCIIPSLRGRSRSLPIEDTLREVRDLVSSGYREVVLSGINLGHWGRDLSQSKLPGRRLDPPTFEGLIRLILTDTGVEKLRISSVEPMDWTDSLIGLVAESPRIAKHAHLPMQSGSDQVLRRMHRRYRPWHYREKVEKIRAAMPDAAIGADVMVGFPGETELEFEETRSLIAELPFTYLHVFTFSARPGTPAATMPGQIPITIARERNRVLRELARGKKVAFMHRFIGRELEAITLNRTRQDEDGQSTEALTDNYLKMSLRGTQEPNRWLKTRVQAVEDETLVAVPSEPSHIKIVVPQSATDAMFGGAPVGV